MKFVIVLMMGVLFLLPVTATDTNQLSAVQAEIAEMKLQIQLAKAELELEKLRAQKQKLVTPPTVVTNEISPVQAEIKNLKEQVALEKARTELKKVQAQSQPVHAKVAQFPEIEQQRDFYLAASKEAKARADYYRHEEQASRYARRALEEQISGFFIESPHRKYTIPNTPFRASFRSANYGFTARGGVKVNSR